MSKKSFSREEAEKLENKPVIGNEVPDNRYQKDQQVAETDDALEVKAPKSAFNAKKVKGKGAELKQEVISDVITGSSNTAGIGTNAAGRSVSGTGDGVLGANNSTPQAGKSRSETRVGKKLDRVATKLNYTPSEQVLLEVDESKPLADAAGDDQGYNGTYRNEFARSQKIAGAVPADLMFQRSVDFIFKDKLYFIEGQMVLQGNDNAAQYAPTHTLALDKNGIYQIKDVSYNLGNYLHRGLHFGLDTNGKVKYFYADVVNLSVNDVNAEDMNMCSAHRLIKSNCAELDRMNMDAKAGDEKADIWTPLARAIDEPTKAAFLMSSIEATTGAYAYLAYSKASTNMAFQLNRGPKDGLDEITPAIDELVGWRASYDDSISVGNAMGNALDKNYIFKNTSYRLGDPALMIDAYDSVNKYHNKADLLLQPRGFRMHLQTADNNINPLKVPEEFANVFAATETFSTIDHEYEPLLPICVTDKANLISAFNFNELAAFCNEGYKDYTYDITYDTTNGYTTYSNDVILVKHGIPAIMQWDALYILYKMSDDEGYDDDAYPEYNGTTHKISIKSHSPLGSSKAKCNIVVTPTTEGFDDYTTLVSIADPTTITYDIVFVEPEEHENLIEDVTITADDNAWTPLNAGEYVYEYSDLRNNYIVEVKHPLIQGIIEYLNNSIGAKFRDLLGTEDLYIPLIFSTQYMTLAQLIICAATPWIARVRQNSMKDVIYYEDNLHEYPYAKLKSIKDVPFKNFVNFSYTDYDTPLETKVMNPVQAINWTMPEFIWKVNQDAITGKSSFVLPWYFNENDLTLDGDDVVVDDDAANMSMPSIRSGIRLGLLDNLYGMSEKDIRLSLDRLTKYFLRNSNIDSYGAYKYGRTTDGQVFVTLDAGETFTIGEILSCPRELGLSMDAPLGVLTVDPADGQGVTTSLKALTADGISTSYRIKIFVNKNTYDTPSILAQFGVNINRAANYTQKWFEITANNATSNTMIAGLVFGMGDDTHTYSPFAAINSGASLSNGINVTSYQRSLNTRLQFLPFVISPFDGNFSSTYTHDIYDIAYMFGLCGFRASDYRESVYNREKRVVNEGLLFVSDPWIEDSPIMRGAALSTGVKMSKGYEIK